MYAFKLCKCEKRNYMRVADLLADPSLQIGLETPSSTKRLAHEISRCAPAEYLDPTPFLDENVLLLTSGIGMNFTDASIWDAYVERLTRVPVAAVAFAVGPAYKELPKGLVAACTKHDVPLLEVPATVAMLKVFQYIETMLQAEQFNLQDRGWSLADECARLASQGAEVSTLLAAINSTVKSPVAIYDAFDTLIAQYPESVTWHERLSVTAQQPDTLTIPLPMGLSRPCQLVVRLYGSAAELETLLAPASSIVAIHLNRSVAIDASSHQDMMRFVSRCVAWSEVTRGDVAKAFQDLGLSQRAETALVVANMSGDYAATAWKLRRALHDGFHEVRIAEFDDRLFALMQHPRTEFDETAQGLLQIDPDLPLVLRSPSKTIDELRIALVHAIDMVKHISKPTMAPRLGLSAVVAAAAGRGAREAALQFLTPLITHDEQRATELLPTLRTWLRHDAQPSRTCEELFIHRNSLSYRLKNIEELLGVSLSSLDGRATCLMALRLVDLEAY